MRTRRRLVLALTALWVLAPAALVAARYPRWWTWIAPEQTPMTWLQSVVLVLAACGCLLVALVLGRIELDRPVRVWWVFAAGLGWLALDERFAVHERVRDGVLAPRDVTLSFLPWSAPGDVLLLAYAVAGLAVLPFVLRAFAPDPQARRTLIAGVTLAALVVAADTVDPTRFSVGAERVLQTAEEIVELAGVLALLAAVALRLVGLLDRHLEPALGGAAAVVAGDTS